MELKNIKRPSIALIKLVEATGILLDIEKSDVRDKSKYKAQSPTNYDNCVEKLSGGSFYSTISVLLNRPSSDISNELALELYTKILEPGFDYETAVNDGGLPARELFNLVYLILLRLQADFSRLPIRQTNILVVVDGSRSSYAAFDLGTHIQRNGMCTVGALGSLSSQISQEHLYSDLLRRCKMQYKLPSHCFSVQAISVDDSGEAVSKIDRVFRESASDILVLGLNDCNVDLCSTADIAQWACWDLTAAVVFVKGLSRSRPFHSLTSPRVFQICVSDFRSFNDVFLKSLIFLRPGDSIVVVAIIDSRSAKGDHRDTRHGLGERCGWIVGGDPSHPNYPLGWNDAIAEQFEVDATSLLKTAQVDGKVRVERAAVNSNASQEFCRISAEEGVDAIILKRQPTREVIVGCIADAQCSVIVI